MAAAVNPDGDLQPLLLQTREASTPPNRNRIQPVSSPYRWFLRNGIACLVVSQLFSTCMPLIVKLLGARFQVYEIVAVQNFISMMAAITLSWIKGTSMFGSPKIRMLCVFRGLTGAMALTCIYGSLYFLPMGDALAIFKMNPATTAFFACVFRLEVVNLVMVLGICGCICGVVFVAHPPFLFGGAEWNHSMFLGIGLALCATLFASSAFLLIGRIGKRATTLTLMIWYHLTALLISIPPIIAGFPTKPVFTPTTSEALLLLALPCCAFVALLLLTHGIQLCNASIGSATLTIELILSYLTGYLVLGEGISILDVLGGALICAGVVLVALGKQGSKAHEVQKVNEYSAIAGDEQVELPKEEV